MHHVKQGLHFNRDADGVHVIKTNDCQLPGKHNVTLHVTMTEDEFACALAALPKAPLKAPAPRKEVGDA